MAGPILLTGLAAGVALVLIAGVVLAWIALYPPVPRDLGGAEDLDDRAERVRIPVGGYAIHGYHLAGRNRTLVLMLPGYGRDHSRVWRYAGFLNARGYGVLAVDFRSSRPGASGEPRLPTTLGHHELPEAQAVLEWVRAHSELGAHTRAVFGESLGGAVAIMLAGANPDVAAVVADGAFADGARALEDACARWARLPRQPTASLARILGQWAAGRDPGATNAEASARALEQRPVFFIHSMRDNRLSEVHVKALWQASGAKDPLWIIDDAGHNEGWLRHRETYEERVTAFLDHHLLGVGEGLHPDGSPRGFVAGVGGGAGPRTAARR